MGVFSTVMSNPYMKWGVAPGAIGAAGGMAYAGYLNKADGTNHSMSGAAAIGALSGLALAAPGGLTSRARRDYAMYSATSKSLGVSPSVSGYSRSLGRL